MSDKFEALRAARAAESEHLRREQDELFRNFEAKRKENAANYQRAISAENALDRALARATAAEAERDALREQVERAPDDEALVELASRALSKQSGDAPDRPVNVGIGTRIIWLAWRLHEQKARAVIAALREAGALK